ncbi:Mur ligase family protein [Methanopyrus sp.]
MKELADNVGGEIKSGDPDSVITGWFSTLGRAEEGDVVIRWWLDDRGAEIASDRGVACLVTEYPRGKLIERCNEFGIPLILTEVDRANEYALRVAREKCAPDATAVCVTGTNGKSTTNHLLHHILDTAGFDTYCNTDFRSEKNTLIDPVVAMELREEQPDDYLCVEISEVQGLPTGRVMEDHAYRMAKALKCELAIVTNVGVDHTNLVSSLDEMAEAVYGVVRALRKGGTAVLNRDDRYVRQMTRKGVETVWYGWNEGYAHIEKRREEEWIILDEEPLIPVREFPLPVDHFLYNALAAVAAAGALGVDREDIIEGLRTYRPLKRRFERLCDDPLIYDDFCHNPDGVLATVRALRRLGRSEAVIVFAIRGSRGVDINRQIARALAEGAKDLQKEGIRVHLIVTSSDGLVDETNVVRPEEREAFLKELERSGVDYEYYDRLEDALERALELANDDTVVLLGGAQGMEPAREILCDMGVI